jgi:hypothetical protein
LDLASPDQSWIFSHGCREEYYHCNIFSGSYILDNGDSCSRLPSNIDQVVRLVFPGILVLVLLPKVIDYFNGCARARSLGIAAQIEIMREPLFVFLGQWFGFIRLPSEKYKIISWKKKEFEDLKDSLCISTMYYLLL